MAEDDAEAQKHFKHVEKGYGSKEIPYCTSFFKTVNSIWQLRFRTSMGKMVGIRTHQLIQGTKVKVALMVLSVLMFVMVI